MYVYMYIYTHISLSLYIYVCIYYYDNYKEELTLSTSEAAQRASIPKTHAHSHTRTHTQPYKEEPPRSQGRATHSEIYTFTLTNIYTYLLSFLSPARKGSRRALPKQRSAQAFGRDAQANIYLYIYTYIYFNICIYIHIYIIMSQPYKEGLPQSTAEAAQRTRILENLDIIRAKQHIGEVLDTVTAAKYFTPLVADAGGVLQCDAVIFVYV